MNLYVECKVEITEGEAGLVFYMTPDQHYEIALRRTDKGVELFRRLCIGDIRHEDHVIALPQGENSAVLCCNASNFTYNFSAKTLSGDIDLGGAQTKFCLLSLQVISRELLLVFTLRNMRIKAIKRCLRNSDAKIRKSMIAKR